MSLTDGDIGGVVHALVQGVVSVKLAFALFKYFPFGGLPKDMLRIAITCASRGHQVTVYCGTWQGAAPGELKIVELCPRGRTNHGRNANFASQFRNALTCDPADVVVGFNKMPGLDIYYAADGCFRAKAEQERGAIYRMTSRCRQYCRFEKAVFGPGSAAQLLMISGEEIPVYQRYYGTPVERFHLLCPGISRDRITPDNGVALRDEFRAEWSLGDNEKLVLMIGSGFKTKGLDRALASIASLDDSRRQNVRLYVIGQDKSTRYELHAAQLGISSLVTFLSGRDDVPRFLLGADLLIHPAYRENTGTVLLEAMVAGLPVLTTDVCGYAHYVEEYKMGVVLPSPFEQSVLNRALSTLLTDLSGEDWRSRGKVFAESADIYEMPLHAARQIEAIGASRRAA